jgi:hypothetical protein
MRFEQVRFIRLTHRLPPWVSSTCLVAVFVLLWVRPQQLRGELVRDLEALLFIETATVLAALFLMPERLKPAEEPRALALLLVAAVSLTVFVGPVVGILVPVHFAARAGAIWRDPAPSRRTNWTFGLSLVALWVAWMAVGLVWIDDGAWSASQVARDVWWEVPSPAGSRLAPHAVPVFGMVYFTLVALAEGYASRMVEAHAQPS